MEISRNEDTVTLPARVGDAGRAGGVKQVFCTPSLAKVADDRGVRKVSRYYGAYFKVLFISPRSGAESTVSVRWITETEL
jgi:hypothetical protein